MAYKKLERFYGFFYGWLVAFTAAMGGFLFGYEIGIINQVFTMHPFKTTFDIEAYDPNTDTYTKTSDADDITGWVTWTFLIGAAVGALVYYPCNMLGRKWTIMLGGVAFMVGVAMETVAGNIATLYLGRVVAGAGTAKTSIRGRLIAVYQFMITIGIFVATCVNSIIIKAYGDSAGDSEWCLAFGLQFVPCALMLASLLALPFSPRWLAYVGRDKEALAVVSQLRGKPDTSEAVLAEYEEIITAVDEKAIGEGSWLELFIDPAVRYRTFLAISLQFLQQWTGINIILYFGSDLYAALGFSEDMANIGFPLINSAVNMFATLPGMWLIEVIGRKLLMTVGGIGMAISLALVCVFGEVGSSQDTLDRLGIGAITFILVFTIFFAATWGPVVWVYQSEIFPLRHRAKGNSAGTVSNWTWNAVISKVAPLILADINYYTYLIFAGACLFMALFALILCPETKGLTLEQVEAVFGQSPAAGRANKSSAAAEVELGELAGEIAVSGPPSQQEAHRTVTPARIGEKEKENNCI